MKHRHYTAAMATFIIMIESAAAATVIYSQDFTSAPDIKVSSNTNTNYFGTGVSTDLNQDDWIYRSGAGNVVYDAVDDNLDITLTTNNLNVYSLLDLSTLLASPGAATQFTISFDVSNYSGTVTGLDFFAYNGTGLEYTGNTVGNGHVLYRMAQTGTNGTITSISPQQGATLSAIFNGTEALNITGNGTFTSGVFNLTNKGSAGDYLFIGFGKGTESGMSFTMDNLKVTAIPEPSVPAIFGAALLGSIAIRRRRSS